VFRRNLAGTVLKLPRRIDQDSAESAHDARQVEQWGSHFVHAAHYKIFF